MKIPAGLIEQVVSTDEHVPSINNVRFEAAASRLIATNCKMLAVVPVEADPGDTDALLPADIFKAARTLLKNPRNRRSPGNVSIRTTPETATLTDGVASEVQTLTSGPFPNYQAILDAAPRSEGPPTMIFDVELLYKLAKAITPANSSGQRIIALWADAATDKVITVRGSENRYAVGLIMPCKVGTAR